MTEQSLTTLDSEELFHLAIHASKQGNHEEAISMLKQSLEQRPDAKAMYILAAEYAEIGMYDRALEGMRQATEMDPSLWTAHFQRGLICMMLQDVDGALASWEPLKTLDEQDPLYHFSHGLSHLMMDQFAEAAEMLEHGISLSHSNPSLAEDMASILERIRAELQKSDDQESTEAAAADTSHGPNHIFLASYNKQDD